MYCRIVLRESTRAFDREYTYAIPAELESRLLVGCRVQVPFGSGNRSSEGYVTAILADAGSDFYIKPVAALL